MSKDIQKYERVLHKQNIKNTHNIIMILKKPNNYM